MTTTVECTDGHPRAFSFSVKEPIQRLCYARRRDEDAPRRLQSKSITRRVYAAIDREPRNVWCYKRVRRTLRSYAFALFWSQNVCFSLGILNAVARPRQPKENLRVS